MRIVVVSHTYIVELNRQIWLEACKADPELEVLMIVPRVWEPGGVQGAGQVKTEPSTTGRLKVLPLKSPELRHMGKMRFGWDFIQTLQKFKPDIIFVEQGAKSLCFAQCIVMKKVLGWKAKLAFFTHWNSEYRDPLPIRLLEQFNLKNTQALVCSNSEGIQLLQKRGYKGPSIVNAQLGVDLEVFYPGDEEQLRNSLNIGKNEFVIGFVGRFVPEKGLETLTKAVALLPASRQFRVLLLGRGPWRGELESLIEKSPYRERFLILDGVTHAEVARYMRLMNVLVIPSEPLYRNDGSLLWIEQFGHVIVEAMACGVPVIGSDSGAIPEVIGNDGLVFPSGDAQTLTDRLLQVFDPDKAKSLSQASLIKATEKYSNRALAVRLLEFFKRL